MKPLKELIDKTAKRYNMEKNWANHGLTTFSGMLLNKFEFNISAHREAIKEIDNLRMEKK